MQISSWSELLSHKHESKILFNTFNAPGFMAINNTDEQGTSEEKTAGDY